MESPGLRRAHNWSASFRVHAVKRPQRWRRNTTLSLWWQLDCVLMGVLWATWKLQPLGTEASSLPRVAAVKWLGGRPLVRQTERDLVELH